MRPANEGAGPTSTRQGPHRRRASQDASGCPVPRGFSPRRVRVVSWAFCHFSVSRRMTSRQNAGIGSVEYHPAEAGASRIHAFPFFFAGFTRSWRCHQTPKAGKARISKSHIHWKHLTFYNSIRYPKSHNGSGSACLYGWTDSCDVGGAIGTASAQSQWSRWEDGLGNAADGD